MEPCCRVVGVSLGRHGRKCNSSIHNRTRGGRERKRGSKRASKQVKSESNSNYIIYRYLLLNCYCTLRSSCIVRHDGNVLPSTAQHSTAHSTIGKIDRYMDG